MLLSDGAGVVREYRIAIALIPDILSEVISLRDYGPVYSAEAIGYNRRNG